MRWFTLLGLVASVQAQGSGQTMLRFGCTNIVVDRLDPLVNPGQIPSGHIHQIVGGNHFNASMVTDDVSKHATCTSCIFSQDFSNYWTANLYYKAKNNTYKRVKQHGHALQFGDTTSNRQTNGILVYYVSYNPGKITAFKAGFRMLVGDPNVRSRPDRTLQRQNCFRCYTGPNFGGDVGAPCMDARVDTEALPSAPCPGGIRTNVLFPTCWDGKNLDTANHKDHVAYPTSGPANFLARPGSCPASHPIQIPQLMYEVVWDTTEFNDRSLWPTSGQPFVLSMGDPTGLGQHADYVFGWKGDSLQKAMDAGGYFGARGAGLETQGLDKMTACTVSRKVNEDIDGWMTELPM